MRLHSSRLLFLFTTIAFSLFLHAKNSRNLPLDSTSATASDVSPRNAKELNNLASRQNQEEHVVQKGDIITKFSFSSPIIIRRYKLLFFPVPKVACTVFKKLFRRMEGFDDWWTANSIGTHSPSRNGLEYLYKVPISEMEEMLTSPEWTKAMFLRDPKDRMLSAYLDKGKVTKGIANNFIQSTCCGHVKDPLGQSSCKAQFSTFEGFVDMAQTCKNDHWKPYKERLDDKHWKYINFFGRFENVAEDAERLLRSLGGDAWDMYGQTGWGEDGNEPIFYSAGANHITNATSKYEEYYTPELERAVEQFYADDYKLVEAVKH